MIKSAFLSKRLYLRPLQRSLPRLITRRLSVQRIDRSFFRTPPHKKRLLLAGVICLSPATFVQISEEDNNGTEETAESRMLAASRAEIKKDVSKDITGPRWLGQITSVSFDLYLLEPLCTGIRFLHLILIFVPVMLSTPVVWFGNDAKNWWFRFLVRGMERAGPTFIKLGQWAASRSDIFPLEMCEIMSQLHSNAPPHSLEETKKIIMQAFDGRPFEEIFQTFDEVPLGVGAIAQVYKAKLKPGLILPSNLDLEDETKPKTSMIKNVDTLIKSSPKRIPSSHVAIKVLHPRVERLIQRDMRIIWFFAACLNAIPTIDWLSLPDEVEQFGEMMKLQLDLRIEATNLTIFRKNFKERTTAWFPYPYLEFTTRQVLVEEFAQGIPLSDFMVHGGGIFQKEIADEGLDAFLKMLLIDNFVHADLHPGNIMVRFYKSEKPHFSFNRQEAENPQSKPDVTEQALARLRPLKYKKDNKEWEAELLRLENEGFRPQLIFIDTGLVTELNATNRKNFLDLFKAVAEFDGYKAGHLMCERCRQPDAVLDKEIFALKMQHLVLGVKSRTLALGNMKIGDILSEVLRMVRTHHVRMEGDFVNVVISILLLEGIGRNLNPHIDLLSCALPILRELGIQGGGNMIQKGDLSMLKVWAGLEARKFMQAHIEDVENCVKYDRLSPNV
ncbi:ABC1 family protein C21C3.03, mitochondrial [Golovinomyces cichoracearum]|uniref:ABC1 family protein C21C3.03, mitochondrial n=1 Tax=Golovinomyces cichoracearum TaxID=62708 RepID=A0A420IIZ4_9PEZI|nr:ABC1 family protein C21C3.03, mitochondrial [Golovinomyces cichoracearum]